MIKVPPLNLINYASVVYLLTRFPLLADTNRGVVAHGAKLYYNQRNGSLNRDSSSTTCSNEVKQNDS